MKWLINHLIKWIVRILCKIDASELERVPDQGPLIVVANHINFLEVPVVITHLLPRPVTGFVKQETYDDPLLGWLFNKIWGGIPINRSIADFKAFRQAQEALKEGKILAVAPEGTRTQDGRLIRGKPGIAILASKCDVPILPIVYYGHENFFENLKRLKRSSMTIRVGRPFKVKFSANGPDKIELLAVTDAIMTEIAKLLPEKYRGYYSDQIKQEQPYIFYLN